MSSKMCSSGFCFPTESNIALEREHFLGMFSYTSGMIDK